MSSAGLRLRLHRWTNFFTGHATFIAIIVALSFSSWGTWQAWEQWEDRVLPPERVTAKQIRINENQRQQLLQAISQYRTPATPSTVPTITFQGTASTTSR